MELLERLTRRLCRTTIVDGDPALLTNGDPVLVEAFVALGWDDPQPDPAPVPDPEPDPVVDPEPAPAG